MKLTRRYAWVPAALPVLVLAIQGWRQRWVTDDAFINFRVVDNLLDGSGPVFNDGERVEAYTSTLWLAILALVHGITGIDLSWISVVMGLALSVAGLAAGSLGALRLWRPASRDEVALPVGAVVVVALPPTWDFATSGLETGLAFAWLGGTFFLLVDAHRRTEDGALAPARSALLAVLVGLGPLVRPDLAVFSVGFLAMLLYLDRRWRLLGWAAALPAAYQVFRMGYFAALVPNTALAKEAGEPVWGRGWDYLVDFVRPYVLFLPLAALAVLALLQLRAPRLRPLPPSLLLAAAPVACGAVHALYVVRVGGDFMHGRLFLPSLFGALLPAMVLPLRDGIVKTAAALVLAWAVVCGVALRTDYDPSVAGPRFEDERATYMRFAGVEDAVTFEDYGRFDWAREGMRLRSSPARLVELRPPVQRFAGDDPSYPDPPSRPGLPNDLIAAYFAVGLVSYGAGPDVTIIDRLGLGDAFASRLHHRPFVLPDGTVRDPRYRAGHEKNLPLPWVVARYADFESPEGRRLARDPQVAAARRALGCGRLETLVDATGDRMTAGRFLSNLGDAFTLHGFRFEADARRTAEAECG